MFLFLRIACATMFFGHAWVCWNGDMPLRALLWDESLLGTVIPRLTGMGWSSWVSSLEVDDGINAAINAQAALFALFGAAALAPLPKPVAAPVLILGSLNLTFLAFLKFWEAGQGVAQFFEHASQFCLPLILLLASRRPNPTAAAIRLAKVALALAFVGHGLYAIGLPAELPWLNHPRPGRFTEMTMLSLGLETEAAAGRILLAAGLLDLLASALLFTRGKTEAAALAYMVAWGLLTALARPWAYLDPAALATSLNQWLPEALYRVPHFALPLWLLVCRRHSAVYRDTTPETPVASGASTTP